MRGIVGKRGQEMSISTLVLIVLAIIVLVIIVVGFTGGWQNLWDRITNLGGGKANVGLVVQACKIACDTGSQFDYEQQLRDVNFDGKTKIKTTCGMLESPVIRGCYNAEGQLVSKGIITDKKVCEGTTGQTWTEGWSQRVITEPCTKF